MDWNLPLLLDNEADEEDHVDESNHQTLVLSLRAVLSRSEKVGKNPVSEIFEFSVLNRALKSEIS